MRNFENIDIINPIKMDFIQMETFVYLGKTDEDRRIPESEQPWRDENGEDKGVSYVWYACYGSNINKGRFMKYINECMDRTPPEKDRPYEFMHSVFFAGTSVTWGGKGKAFLDDTADKHSYGRVYKIKREQYEEVKEMEGSDYTKKVELGMLEGIPVVTFTCRRRPERSIPSVEYFDTILAGLREIYPDMRESAVAEELIRGIFNEDEIRILDCLRESEHGVEIRRITEITGLEPRRVKDSIMDHFRASVVRQDRRSRQYEATV